MSTIEATIVWAQTRTERYDTDVNQRAVAAIKAIGLEVVAEEGGCSLNPEDPLPGDNGVEVKGEQEALDKVPDALRFILGHPETLSVRTYEPEVVVVTAHEHPYGWSEAKHLATGSGIESFVHDHERGDALHEHVLKDGDLDAMLAQGLDVVKRTTWQEDGS